MELLIQFLLRLTFGLAIGMALTSPKLVSSGYYRNHLYVTLGLSALAALLANTVAPEASWYAIAAAVLSYFGSVIWLYEKSLAGRICLCLIAGLAIFGAAQQVFQKAEDSVLDAHYSDWDLPAEITQKEEYQEEKIARMDRSYRAAFLSLFSLISSGLVLGFTMAAMLLGHWYLNSPGMQLQPLRWLIIAMSIAVAVQAILSALGLWGELAANSQIGTQWILFVVLRWTFGIVGVAVMALMAWKTLDIPNTQSATGILYVAVIGTFVGETMALLLSSESLYPL